MLLTVDRDWLVEIVLRSTLLLCVCFVLERLFHSNHVFRSRLWFTSFLGLFLILIPRPHLDLAILGARHSIKIGSPVYEVQSGFHPRLPAEQWIPLLVTFTLIIGLTLWFLRGLTTWRLIKRAEQCSNSEAIAQLYESSERLGLQEAPLLLLSDEIESPCIAGVLNPVLLVPVKIAGNPDDPEWQVVLTHELIHLRTNDQWRLLVTDLVATLYWWHPLSWFGLRRARLAFEMECDQKSIQALGFERAAYARILSSRQVDTPRRGQVRFWSRGSTLRRIRGLSWNSKSPWPILSLALFFPIIVPVAVRHRLERHFDPDVIGLDEIVFVSDRTGLPSFFRMWSDGTAQRQMARTFMGASAPSVSPDGTEIAYVREENGDRHIFVANTSGRNERRVVALTHRDDQPVFSPDGKRLIFMSNTGKRWMLGISNIVSGKWKMLVGNSFTGLEARWHPNGKRIILSANHTGLQKIWSVDIGGKDLKLLSGGMNEETGAAYRSDGGYAVYSSHQQIGYNVLTVDLRNGTTKQLTNLPGVNTEARFNAASDQIFFSTDRSGRTQIASMNLDGTSQRILTDSGSNWWAVSRY